MVGQFGVSGIRCALKLLIGKQDVYGKVVTPAGQTHGYSALEWFVYEFGNNERVYDL